MKLCLKQLHQSQIYSEKMNMDESTKTFKLLFSWCCNVLINEYIIHGYAIASEIDVWSEEI